MPSVINMLAQHDKPFSELISRAYPFQAAPRAFGDWAAAPSHFTKILIDLKV